MSRASLKTDPPVPVTSPQRPKLPTFWVELTTRQRFAIFQAVMHPRPGADRKAGARLMTYASLGVISDASELHGRVSPLHIVKGKRGWAELDSGCRDFLQAAVDYAPKEGDRIAPAALHPVHATSITEVIQAFDDGCTTAGPGFKDTLEDWAPSKYEEELRAARAQIAELVQALAKAQGA